MIDSALKKLDIDFSPNSDDMNNSELAFEQKELVFKLVEYLKTNKNFNKYCIDVDGRLDVGSYRLVQQGRYWLVSCMDSRSKELGYEGGSLCGVFGAFGGAANFILSRVLESHRDFFKAL